MTRVYCLIFVAGAVAVAGCEQPGTSPAPGTTTSDDVRRDIGQAVDTTAEYADQTKEEYQQKLDARLQELDAEIAKLREKGQDLKDDAKVRWEENMASLETKREAARVKLAELKNSSSEAWKEVREGAQAAWEEMEAAFQKASSEF
jgi:TolA-binding protein